MSRIAEPAREAFLYQIWKKKSIDNRTLYSIDGKPLIIRERGIQNYDAGPDFINALLQIGDDLVRGDVEIHPVAGDWYNHGHHRDPRYNQVMLHVVTMDCPSDFKTIRQDGGLVLTLNLDMYLEVPAEVMEQEQDAEEAPQVKNCALRSAAEPCKKRVLEFAGDLRFQMHASQFREVRQQNNWDQIMYQALCESLGYAKNQIPFRNLAQRLPVNLIWEFLWNDSRELAQAKCDAYLFGAAGLLPSQAVQPAPVLDPDMQEYVDILETCWSDFPWREKITPLKPEAWKFFRLRPLNFPTRRIAAAAQLITRFMDEGFIPACYKVIMNTENMGRKMVRELERLFKIKSCGVWERHYHFAPETAPMTTSNWLIGNDRIRDMLVNVVLPALYAYARESDDLRGANAVQELYVQFPTLSENQVTRRMLKQIFADAGKDALETVRQQQGLIHLDKFYCTQETCNACFDIIGQSTD